MAYTKISKTLDHLFRSFNTLHVYLTVYKVVSFYGNVKLVEEFGLDQLGIV